ncbi:MAG TPA: hypothetical protein VHW02_05785 [Rhizomicrobium sp.]|jgi:hypothetical protein|nr:hypothetical protein [Rhizomicrobium sp.]
MRRFQAFHLHGDNIVECERTLDLIRRSLADVTKTLRGPYGYPVCPSYELRLQNLDTPVELTMFPGFGRWNQDILELIRRRGGTLREAADIIVTGVADGSETPLIAIEYCGALPAGNQAWQRNGRAYSFGKAEVPYLYVAELGGYELAADRARKAARLPNPAVPFSYLAFSVNNRTPTLPIFVTSPGADEKSRAAYASVFSEAELLKMVRSVILAEDNDTTVEALRVKALAFVETKAATSRYGETLSREQWQAAYETIKKRQSLVEFVVSKAPLKWSKTAYIEAITKTARSLMDFSATLAIGLTSSKLPMCVIPKMNRRAFADQVEKLSRGRVQAEFMTWLRREKNLAVCWVMGFKPRGDDARPDRGLPPLARMLIGPDEDLLTFVYGPAPEATWQRLHTTPRDLLANGLWEAIYDASDALLVDSSTDGVRRHGYLRSHWHQVLADPKLEMVLVQPTPTRISENDVDTVLHLLLSRYGGKSVFEGMCNPPGGDWSGVSLEVIDRTKEVRWLTLPRVSKTGDKRPDHVFQFFIPDKPPIILCIESKETSGSVEPKIGPRLTSYIAGLMNSAPSIERKSPSGPWKHSADNLDVRKFVMASAVAFVTDTEEKIAAVRKRADVDLLMSFDFKEMGKTCSICLMPNTKLGREIAAIMGGLDLARTNIGVKVE